MRSAATGPSGHGSGATETDDADPDLGGLVSAIVLAFNEPPTVARCLQAVRVALTRVPGKAQLVVVLNEPTLGQAFDLQDATVIAPGANLGFAGGVEAGIGAAGGEWIAVVNDDCEVADDAIAHLLEAGRSDDRIGSVAPQVRFAQRPGIINSAGLEVDRLGVAYERLLGEPVGGRAEEACDVFGASGAFALYRRAMLDDIGGFDASFFAYLEDADVAWRARMRGWRAVYEPRAVATHAHSPTLGHGSPRKHYLVGRNRVRLLAKNATTSHLLRYGLAVAAYDCAYVAAAAAASRSLAPLRGRLRGLREWSVYRVTGVRDRRSVALAPAGGIREALRRNRTYRSLARETGPSA